MAEMPASYAGSTAAESVYSVGTPSEFDITTFPNASRINVHSEETQKKKMLAPNAQLRALDHVPQPMIINEDDEIDDIEIHTVKSITPETINNYTNPSKRDRILRWISTSLAIMASLLLFVGICMNDTANSYWSQGSGTDQISMEIECGWINLNINGNKSETEIGGAFVCLIFMITAFIFTILGIIYVQPFRIQTRKCILAHFARMWFILSFIFILISIIAFVGGDSICFTNNELNKRYQFKLGGSIILDIIALLLIFPCCIIAM